MKKLTIDEIIIHIDRVICPCMFTCPALSNQREVLKWLSLLGYNTSPKNLKKVISRLYDTRKYPFSQTIYSKELIKDISKIYRGLKLGHTKFFRSLLPG